MDEIARRDSDRAGILGEGEIGMTKRIYRTKLKVDRKHFVTVTIWPMLKSMQAHIRKLSKKDESDTHGYFHAPKTKIYSGNRVQEGVVGEIHLVKGRFGAGVFAHELQHFISWWCNIKELDPIEKHWEYVPKLAGNMTNEFWSWFYEQKGLE